MAKKGRLECRLDDELDDMLAAEERATGLTRSQVARYLMRRALDTGITPREAGAREGFFAAVAEVKAAMGEMLTEVMERVKRV